MLNCIGCDNKNNRRSKIEQHEVEWQWPEKTIWNIFKHISDAFLSTVARLTVSKRDRKKVLNFSFCELKSLLWWYLIDYTMPSRYGCDLSD